MRRKNIGLVIFLLLFLLVWTGVSEGAPVIKAAPLQIQPGEKIFVRFSGAPGNKTDWIAVYPVGEKSENYGEWYYLGGKTSGELIFTAPKKKGDYEFRLFANWPEGGYKVIAVSNVIRVSVSAPLIDISPRPYRDVFRLSTGEIIIGELLSFNGTVFKIKTEEKVIEKTRKDIIGIFLETRPVKVRTLSQWASKARASSEYSASDWSARQATGKPDTLKCGDIKTAWAPKSSGPGPEWLELTFDTPVYATKLRVHETYNAGFIYKVEFVDIRGGKYTIWQGKDTTPCPGWFEIKMVPTSYLVRAVIIHTSVKGWEEIDAVELTGIAPED